MKAAEFVFRFNSPVDLFVLLLMDLLTFLLNLAIFFLLTLFDFRTDTKNLMNCRLVLWNHRDVKKKPAAAKSVDFLLFHSPY